MKGTLIIHVEVLRRQGRLFSRSPVIVLTPLGTTHPTSPDTGASFPYRGGSNPVINIGTNRPL